MANSNVLGLVGAEAGKYLSFALASEEYGLKILQVREIIGEKSINNTEYT